MQPIFKKLNLIVAILLLSGCTGSSDYDLLKDELVQLRTEVDTLNEENAALKEQFNEGLNNSLKVVATLKDTLDNATKEFDKLRERYVVLESSIFYVSGDMYRLGFIIDQLPNIETKMVYISDYNLENQTMLVNEIEWVTTYERLEELDIQAEMSNGFYIYDSENKNTEMNYSIFLCYLLEGAASINASQDELWKYLEQEKNSELKYPFILTIMDGKVIEIKQQYLP